jgi:hypothetical protein
MSNKLKESILKADAYDKAHAEDPERIGIIKKWNEQLFGSNNQKKGVKEMAKQRKNKWGKWNKPTPDRFPTREVRTKEYETKNYKVNVIQEKDLKGIPLKDNVIFETITYKNYLKKGKK